MDKPNVRERERLLVAAHRDIWLRSLRKRLVNHDFSILSNKCVGGLIYKDLGLPFLTPTVNLSIKPCDFIRLCLDVRGYMEREPVEVKTEKPYPVGRIGDIEINFIHYDSFKTAHDAWERRKVRLRYDNIYVIMKESKSITPQDRENFRMLSYPKVMFVPWEASEPWEFHISGCDRDGHLGDITRHQRPGFRYFEQFDFVSFLNQSQESCL